MLGTILILLVIALIPANIAKNKGRDFWLWYLYGIAIWIVAIIHAVSMDSVKSEKNDTVDVKRETLDIQQTSFNIPLFIKGYKIVDVNGKLYLQVCLKNIYSSRLKAIRCEVIGKDSFNKNIMINGRKSFEVKYQDLNLASGEQQNIQSNVELPSEEIRSVKICIREALFDNDELLVAKVKKISDKLDPLTEDDIIAGRNKYPQSLYYPNEYEEYWTCSCGYRNVTEVCRNCNSSKKEIITYFEKTNLIKEATIIKNNKLQQEQKNKKNTKRMIVISTMVVVFVLSMVIYTTGKLSNVFQGEWKFRYYGEEYDTYTIVRASGDSLYGDIYKNGDYLGSFDFDFEIGENEQGEDVIFEVHNDGSKSEWMIITSHGRNTLDFVNPRGQKDGYASKQ